MQHIENKAGPTAASELAAGRVAPSSASAGRPIRILIVEDNQDAADTMRLALQMLDFQVTVAYTDQSGQSQTTTVTLGTGPAQ